MKSFLTRLLSYSYQFPVYKDLNLSSSNTFYAKDLQLTTVKQLKPLPEFDQKTLKFGTNDTDHLLTIAWNQKTGWSKPQIKPFTHLQIHPFNSTLHYSIQAFQGLKAYKNDKGKIRLFRPQCNMHRFLNSTRRMSLPEFDGNQLLKLIQQYVRIQHRWICPKTQFSLYLRPIHISMQNSLGVKTPQSTMIVVMASPVGPYFSTGFKPSLLSCSTKDIRSAPRGTGGYKIGGNYGPTIKSSNQVYKKGFDQILWLYQNQIVQVGTSNVFFVFKGKNGKKAQIVTPLLKDLILPGVTRDSVLGILDDHPQYDVSQRIITINQVIQRNNKGQVLQCFSAGTAVIIGPVKIIQYQGINHNFSIDQKLLSGPITYQIRKQLLDIQQGRITDKRGWAKVIN